MAPYYIGRP